MSARLLLSVAVVLGACAGAEAPTPIAIDARGSALLAIEDGAGWRVLAADADGVVEDAALEPYTIVRVCERPGVVRWEARQSGEGAPEVWPLDCADPVVRVAVTVEVTGLLAASDRVAVYFGAAQGQGGVLSVAPGTHDLIVVDHGETAGRIAIRRGVTVTGPTTISVDFEREGAALRFRGLDRPTGDATAAQLSVLRTAGGTSAMFPAPREPGFWLAPSELLIAGDVQAVGIDVGDVSAASRVVRPVDATGAGAPLVFTEPGRIEAMDVTAERATWTYAGAWTIADLAGPAWSVRAHGPGRGDGAIELPDVASIPGWRWSIPSTSAVHLMLTDLRAPDDFTIVTRSTR